MGIKEEITKIAVEQGYEGAKPKSIAQAIDALTDTLAGEDVKSGRSVVGAVKALAPYIGSGGGGGFEPKGVATITISGGLTVPEQEYFLFNVDSRGPLQSMSDVPDYGNVYRGVAALSGTTSTSVGTVGGGLYVAVNVVGSNGAIDADKVAVEFNDAEITGVTKLTFGDNVILTFQVPEDTQSGVSRISIFYDGGEG